MFFLLLHKDPYRQPTPSGYETLVPLLDFHSTQQLRYLIFVLYLLSAKAPLLAYNSFVEAVFVLNDCDAHVVNNKSHSSKVENRLFSIR